MSQTDAIIPRIKADRASEFERAASLTRVEYGVEEEDAKKRGYVNY